MNAPSAQVYQFGDFRLETAKRLLWRNGAQVPLTPRVFETLLYMVEHRDTVLDKERLMEAVWPDSIVEENNLTQNISTLRRVFGETPSSHHYIVTVPGRGYRFVAEVRLREPDTGPEPRRIPETATERPETERERVVSVSQPDQPGNRSPAERDVATRSAQSRGTVQGGRSAHQRRHRPVPVRLHLRSASGTAADRRE